MERPWNLRPVLAALVGALALAACGPGSDSGGVAADGEEGIVADESDAGPGVDGGDGDGPDAEVAADRADAPAMPALGTDADALDEAVVLVTTPDTEVRVDVKVAATDADRRRGLMGVADLPPGAGMLFVFDEDRDGGFWMRDTLIPLDIAYVAGDGTIGTILAMEPCEAEDASDCQVYPPDAPYRSALEVPQGWFASVGIAVGDTVTWSDPVPVG